MSKFDWDTVAAEVKQVCATHSPAAKVFAAANAVLGLLVRFAGLPAAFPLRAQQLVAEAEARFSIEQADDKYVWVSEVLDKEFPGVDCGDSNLVIELAHRLLPEKLRRLTL